MAKSQKREVVPHKNHELEVLTERPEWLTDQARGNENVGVADLVLPRIELCQPLSPCKDKNDPANYIPGIEDGDLFNTVSREKYGENCRIVPVFYRPQFLLFKLRKAGGGFRGSFNTRAEAEAKRAEQDSPHDHEVVDCGEHIVLVQGPHGLQQAIIAMTKTKQKVSRQLNSFIAMTNEDRWARAYTLGSVRQQNDKGTFYNFTIKPIGYVDHETFKAGLKLYEFLAPNKGAGVRASYEDMVDVSGGDGSDSDM